MALASYESAKSVVALSKSPIFHHQFPSITKAISGLAKDEREFKRDIFVAVVGKKRKRLGLAEVAEVFYHRFDLEGTNRFMKQNLFLESYQS